MLGETRGTSAGGASEDGKKLRVPGTNPFWFEEDSSQGNRMLELLQPRRLYERQGRGAEYERIVAQLLAERREYLAAFTNLW